MPVKTTKNDLELIKLLGEFKMLTVSQFALLSQRSRQVIRRRIRFLIKSGTHFGPGTFLWESARPSGRSDIFGLKKVGICS